MYSGYIRFRRGIFDHLGDGRLSISEYAIYTFLLGLADSRTGIVTPTPRHCRSALTDSSVTNGYRTSSFNSN